MWEGDGEKICKYVQMYRANRPTYIIITIMFSADRACFFYYHLLDHGHQHHCHRFRVYSLSSCSPTGYPPPSTLINYANRLRARCARVCVGSRSTVFPQNQIINIPTTWGYTWSVDLLFGDLLTCYSTHTTCTGVLGGDSDYADACPAVIMSCATVGNSVG